MARRRDLLIILGLFAVLTLFILMMPDQHDEQNTSNTPTTHSSGAGGALALLRWAQQLGYAAERLEYTDFAVDATTDALVILNPSIPITGAQSDAVLAWVEAGGTLILADDGSRAFASNNQLFDDLELDLRVYDDEQGNETPLESVPILQPVFDSPPVAQVVVRARRVFASERTDLAPLAGLPDGTVIAGLRYGAGYIYLSSSVYPFTNAGLREADNASLVLNLLNRLPPGARILFDEYHHGFFEPPSLRAVLFANPWGWALIYSVALIGLYLIATGRRFGRPIPLREEIALRSSAEYVESMADLFQRGKKRHYIAEHYATAFKRRLARPYGINPQRSDAEFVAELAHYREVDTTALLDLLQRLQHPDLSEEELVRLVAAADAIPAR